MTTEEIDVIEAKVREAAAKEAVNQGAVRTAIRLRERRGEKDRIASSIVCAALAELRKQLSGPDRLDRLANACSKLAEHQCGQLWINGCEFGIDGLAAMTSDDVAADLLELVELEAAKRRKVTPDEAKAAIDSGDLETVKKFVEQHGK